MNLKYYLRGLGIGILVTAIIMLVISGKNQKPMSNEEIKQRAAALGMVEEESTLSNLAGSSKEETSEAGKKVTLKVDDSNTEPQTDNEVNKEETGSPNEEASFEPEATLTPEEEKELIESVEGKKAVTPEEMQETMLKTPEPTKEPSEDENKEPGTTEEETAVAEPTKEAKTTPEPTAEAEPTKAPKKVNEGSQTVALTIARGDSSYKVAQKLEDLGLVENARSFDGYLCKSGKDRRIHAGSYEIPQGSTEEEIAQIISG